MVEVSETKGLTVVVVNSLFLCHVSAENNPSDSVSEWLFPLVIAS